jgi:hypothetical protein
MTATEPDDFTPMLHQAEGVMRTHLGVPVEEASEILRTSAERVQPWSR